MNRTGIKASENLPLPDDKPLVDRIEANRATETYREYTLTECERLAYIEKYGAPTRPYRPSSNGYDAKRRGGKGA